MKIITIKGMLLLAFITLGISSCKKSLEENNLSGLTSETVYTNAAGFETLVSASYTFSPILVRQRRRIQRDRNGN